VLGDPVNFIDPLGLWTVGVSFNVGSGAGFGGTVGINFVVGYGSASFSSDIQKVVGMGSYAGSNGGFSVGIEESNADNVSNLCGFGYQFGASAGEVAFGEANFFGGDGCQGRGNTGSRIWGYYLYQFLEVKK